MKTVRVLTLLRFLDTTKKIDGLWKKPPYAHSTVFQVGLFWLGFFPPTSSGLDHLAKETEERVTRLDSCIPFLANSFTAVCHDCQSIIFLKKLMLHPCRRQNNSKNSTNVTAVEREDGSFKPNYIFSDRAKDFYMAFLVFSWQLLPLWAQNSS